MLGAFRNAVDQARGEEGLCFASLLPEERILQAFRGWLWQWQGWIYTPAVTVWVFLSQGLSPDHSCRDAVAGLIAWRLARGQSPCSAQTGAYCTARAKIPERVCRELMRDTARHVQQQAPADWNWCGRRVRDVDVLVRKHQLRPTDFRRGQRPGKDDHLVVWAKPARPQWMSVKEYESLPESPKSFGQRDLEKFKCHSVPTSFLGLAFSRRDVLGEDGSRSNLCFLTQSRRLPRCSADSE